jgi:hypothetical protein
MNGVFFISKNIEATKHYDKVMDVHRLSMVEIYLGTSYTFMGT